MVYTIKEIAERIRPVAEEYNLNAVYLFGSYAKGMATESSDIDFLIDDTGSGLRGIRYGGLFMDLQDCVEKPIDMLTEKEKNAAYSDDVHFAANLDEEKLKIYDSIR
ncbi:MAG: nucleotidyltransferase domain-containing protein [Ruminococcus sp.]|jgi:predicted nucleotidyltransferase|nr:nucleotidyltransferase domain-containing protein [Ruminococcus sp.]